ncbi:MAG TPA: hypothetical protein VL854_05615 [Nitrososphaeraceae archaeon]|jgi:hypothetical protein|nr:hypothetical protein [Nitrososphaeraceae archaeon]
MNPYTARKNELKARLEDEMRAFVINPSAVNYNELENTMLIFQNHVKNTDPSTYNEAWEEYQKKYGLD